MRKVLLFFLTVIISCCQNQGSQSTEALKNVSESTGVKLIVLGNVQDAGSPHPACKKACCSPLFEAPDPNRKVVSLGLLDYDEEKSYLFDATPDLPTQMKILSRHAVFSNNETPDGIFLTHAHIGHYSGLMYLGREAMGADRVKVFAMPKMRSFLESNGPWDQLIELNNIEIIVLQNENLVSVTKQVSVLPFTVPHRDEYSETIGFKITGPHKAALFIPDIDKWSVWQKPIAGEISKVDYAFIDATFFEQEEVKPRDISEIPHPFVVEKMELLSSMPDTERKKVYFIHFNHTNPLLDAESKASMLVESRGFRLARMHQEFEL